MAIGSFFVNIWFIFRQYLSFSAIVYLSACIFPINKFNVLSGLQAEFMMDIFGHIQLVFSHALALPAMPGHSPTCQRSVSQARERSGECGTLDGLLGRRVHGQVQ